MAATLASAFAADVVRTALTQEAEAAEAAPAGWPSGGRVVRIEHKFESSPAGSYRTHKLKQAAEPQEAPQEASPSPPPPPPLAQRSSLDELLGSNTSLAGSLDAALEQAAGAAE